MLSNVNNMPPKRQKAHLKMLANKRTRLVGVEDGEPPLIQASDGSPIVDARDEEWDEILAKRNGMRKVEIMNGENSWAR